MYTLNLFRCANKLGGNVLNTFKNIRKMVFSDSIFKQIHK